MRFIPTAGADFDIFITEEGADRIEITTFAAGAEGADIALGLKERVTDFTPGEDMIFIDPSQPAREFYRKHGNSSGADFFETDLNSDRDLRDNFSHEFILREDMDGAYPDVDFTVTATQTRADGRYYCAGGA